LDSGWIIYTDGASKGNPGPAGAGWIIEKRGTSLGARKGKFLGLATNNEAEYQALILALEEALALGADTIKVYMDSELLVRQLNGLYKVRSPKLVSYYEKSRELLSKFIKYAIIHINREANREADRLANYAIREYRKTSGSS
jgi:ribonuclease HI